MIGVLANPSDHDVIREFFELFKTPWELCQPHRKYDVLLCSGSEEFEITAAQLIVIYSGRKLPVESAQGVQAICQGNVACAIPYKGLRIPIYGDCVLFREDTETLPASEPVGKYRRQVYGREIVRIGYDLFGEVRRLLTSGQPAVHASVPTLDLHIALLRDLIVASEIPFAEIPPVPDGYRFIACLTHDVDHPLMRRHRFDRTMFGFLYRACWGTLLDVIRGRRPWRHLRENWTAAVKLPLVLMGLATDPWSEFNRYAAMEGQARSSFFVIPFADRPGRTHNGTAPSARAARYRANDVTSQIHDLIAAGCEIGLHGIDSWHDSSAADRELTETRRVASKQEMGVRMHWLYFNEQSPMLLDQAGALYDSTMGYNETIGYRAGTTQAYRPLGARELIELPMHVMDTALFFPDYLHLSASDAEERIGHLIQNAVELGGTLTLNWHDRSIAPERLWGDTYLEVVEELRNQGAWFATASEATCWFRMRRSVEFKVNGDGTVQASVPVNPDATLPSLKLRTYRRGTSEPNEVVVPPNAKNVAVPYETEAATQWN